MKDLLLFVSWPLRAGYGGLVWVANRPKALMLGYFVMIIVTSVLFAVFEHKDVGTALWWAVVTASTVGYGDTSPTTAAGRVVAGILISAMVLLVIPLITAHFASKLIVDQDAFRHEEQEEIKEQLRRIRVLTEQLAESAGVSEPGSAARPAAPADR